jgi:hypothetical protein
MAAQIAEVTFWLNDQSVPQVRARLDHNLPPTVGPHGILRAVLQDAIQKALTDGGVWEDDQSFFPWHQVQRVTVDFVDL